MPRAAEPTELARVFPWKQWEAELKKSPTKALVFGPEDFGEISPYAFKKRVLKALGHLNIRATERRGEVLVVLDA